MIDFITKHYNWMLMSKQIREECNTSLLDEYINHRRNFNYFEDFLTWWRLPETLRIQEMRGEPLKTIGELI